MSPKRQETEDCRGDGRFRRPVVRPTTLCVRKGENKTRDVSTWERRKDKGNMRVISALPELNSLTDLMGN